MSNTCLLSITELISGLCAAPSEEEARVEVAILRDFSKALSKLVGKMERREAELEEAAKRQATEPDRLAPGQSHHSPIDVTNTWQGGQGDWGSPPMANGNTAVHGNRFASASASPHMQVRSAAQLYCNHFL